MAETHRSGGRRAAALPAPSEASETRRCDGGKVREAISRSTMRAVSFRCSRFRIPRLATSLALFALLAQLWMGQVSTGHLARLLTGGAAALDICSAGDASDGDAGGAHRGGTAQPFNCPVCFVAAAGAAPAAGAPVSQDALAPARPRAFQHSLEPRAQRRAGLRPPPQAPPVA